MMFKEEFFQMAMIFQELLDQRILHMWSINIQFECAEVFDATKFMDAMHRVVHVAFFGGHRDTVVLSEAGFPLVSHILRRSVPIL